MIEESAQPGILAHVPVVARSLTFNVIPEADAAATLHRFAADFPPEWGIVGIGQPTVLALNAEVAGLRTFPAFSGPGCSVPSTQQALWIRLCGPDRGVVFDAARRVTELLGTAFEPAECLDTFTYHGGKDLTRFEDGTANPTGEAAVRAAFVANAGDMAGSSFAAVQKWVHDLDRFASFSQKRRDEVIGRSAETNEELSAAPPFAHVMRSAQETYDPPAYMLRRSMPWADADQQGLEFVAFGESLDRFERVLKRMTGLDDRVVDGLFLFSRPVTGGYYWCPPVADGKLNLAALKPHTVSSATILSPITGST